MGGAYEPGALALGLAGLDQVLVRGEAGLVSTGSGQPVVRREELVDVSADPDVGVHQDDQVVADSFQVGDQVGRHQHADPVLGDGGHQVLQELATRERVEAGHGLVEDQQLRALGDGQREGELGALAARELAGPLLRVEAELPYP